MFRTILVKKSSKIQVSQGYFVIYDGEKETKVYVKDVSLLLIESSRTLITMPVLLEVVKNNISMIFCDEKHNPIGTIMALNENYASSFSIYKQIEWKEEIKANIWSKIVSMKIKLQSCVLKIFEKNNYELLLKYIDEIKDNDISNREGFAAKVYFNSLFGNDFNRSEISVINDMLNYGYSILLSCFNREIVSLGYITQIGIFHKGKTNPFNLSCDFMEVFRPIVDILAYLNLGSYDPIKEMRKLLSYKVLLDGKERYIDDAIRVFTINIIRLLNGDDFDILNIEILPLERYKNDKNNEINSNV